MDMVYPLAIVDQYMKNGRAVIQPVPIDGDLKNLITDAAHKTHLTQAEVMRTALRIGVPEVVKRLQVSRKPRRNFIEYMDAFAGLLPKHNREMVKPSQLCQLG